MSPIQQQLYALSGLFQSVYCIRFVAMRTEVLPEALDAPLIQAILTQDSKKLTDIFDPSLGHLQSSEQMTVQNIETHFHLDAGLKFCQNFLRGDKNFPRDSLELLINLLRLERRLHKSPQAQAELGQGIKQVIRQKNHFQFDTVRIYESLAGLYSSHLRSLDRPILVKGTPQLLQQPLIQHKVRGLLLAGVRCAVLWRQLGGKRRHFLLNRKKLLQETYHLESKFN